MSSDAGPPSPSSINPAADALKRARQEEGVHEGRQVTLEEYYRARYPKYTIGRHIELLCRELDNLGPNEALIINMPPRHSKSETVGAFIERYMGQNPDHEVMYTCYGSQLATERSRKIRNYVRTSKTFRKFFPTFRLAADQKKVTEWKTAEDGGFLASGVDGSLTGKGAHLLIVDDPIKGRKQAESGKIRQTVIDWFKGDAFTRLAPNARIIIIQTRWHTEDLTGWLLDNRQDPEFGAFNWKVVSLPAIAEPTEAHPDPLGRQEGEGLWPERFPNERYNGIRKLVGEYDWAAQFQQRPYLKGGNVFSDQPAEYPNVYDPQTLRGLGARITVVCDQGASDSSSADYTTIEVAAHWGSGVEHRMDVVDVRRGQWDLDELLAQTLAVQKTWGVEVAIECVMNQVAVVQFLEKRGLKTKRLNPRAMGTKFVRALPASAAWNRGAIRVPKAENVQWNVPGFVTEHARFTGAESDASNKDDQVDTTAYNWLLGETGETRKPNRAGAAGRAATTPGGTFRGGTRARPNTGDHQPRWVGQDHAGPRGGLRAAGGSSCQRRAVAGGAVPLASSGRPARTPRPARALSRVRLQPARTPRGGDACSTN